MSLCETQLGNAGAPWDSSMVDVSSVEKMEFWVVHQQLGANSSGDAQGSFALQLFLRPA